jgi:hypothetical protein
LKNSSLLWGTARLLCLRKDSTAAGKRLNSFRKKNQQLSERESTAFGKGINSFRTNSTALKGHSFTGSEAQLHSLQKKPNPKNSEGQVHPIARSVALSSPTINAIRS